MFVAQTHAGLFRSRSAFGWFLAVAFVEAIHASRGIDELLLTGEERMARGTDFHVQVALLGRARLERLAAGAGDVDFYVFRVNSWFHYSSSLYGSTWPRFQTRHHRWRSLKPSS